VVISVQKHFQIKNSSNYVMALAVCLLELPNVKASDTTGGDSSNLTATQFFFSLALKSFHQNPLFGHRSFTYFLTTAINYKLIKVIVKKL